MGRLAKLLSFIRTVRNGANVSDVKIDPGGGPNITAQHFADPGDDSFPLTTDYPVSIDVAGSGRESIVGYVDPLNTPVAQPGDKRIYARDANSGAIVVEVWLKNDGTATIFNSSGNYILKPDGEHKIFNDNGTFILQPDGEFNINGARITIGGDIITASGVSLDNHFHEQGADSDGDSEVATDPPTATE